MGRPINAQRFLGANAPHQIQATVWGTADSSATAGYLTQQNSPHRFRTTTVNGTSLTTFVNGSGNLVAGTSYVKVFPEGSYVTTPATGTAKLKALATGNSVVSGGNGYVVGDYINFVGGTFTTAANVQVTAISGANAVVSVSSPVAGTQGYTVLPSNVAAITTSNATGNGSGAVLSFNFGVESASVTTGGAGYTAAAFVVEGETVAPTFTQPTVVAYAVTTGAVVVLTPGVVNVNPVVVIEESSGTTEYVKTLTSMNYLNTYQGNQYRWLYKGQIIPSDYASLGVKLCYLDTL
jgi:hypothetical protein